MRWLKFSKYLGRFGWAPTIYAPDGGEMPGYDPSLISEISSSVKVIRRPIWEPYQLYKMVTGRRRVEHVYSGFISEGGKERLGQKLSVWIRGNLFIPDARKFWIGPSIRFLRDLLKRESFDALVSTGPPHSMHMIALGVKKAFPSLPWLADFRDPWTGIDFYEQLRLTRWADSEHRRMERAVLERADIVTTVSWSWSKELSELAGGRSISVITNGYDKEDFSAAPPQLNNEFSIVHLGSMNADRNPVTLWRALAELCDTDPAFRKALRISLIGPTDESVFDAIHDHGLLPALHHLRSVSHGEALGRLRAAQVALLPINRTPNALGVVPGKLFEYLAAQRPILLFGPAEGDAARILRETEAGEVIDYDDVTETKLILARMFSDYVNSSLESRSNGVERYSRLSLSEQMAGTLDSMSAKAS